MIAVGEWHWRSRKVVGHQGRIHGLKSGGTNHDEREERGAEGCEEEVSPPHQKRALGATSPEIFSILSSKWQVFVHSGS